MPNSLHAHTPLDEETIKLKVSYLVINSLLSYEAFMVLKDFRIPLQNKCRPSKTPIDQDFALVYIDDSLHL